MARKSTPAAKTATAAADAGATTAANVPETAVSTPKPAEPEVAAADDQRRTAFTADLGARLNAQLEELAAERGITPEEIIAFARDLLGGSAENIKLIAPSGATADHQGAFEVPEGHELIFVIGPPGGKRRAGHLFDGQPRPVIVTAEQKAAIEADPALSLATREAAEDAALAALMPKRPGAEAFAFGPAGLTRVKVLGPAGGRRRIGHHFGAEESVLEVDRDQLEQLLGDGQLSVIAG